MLKYKQLRYLIFSTAIMLVNGCGVYGAKQFDPNVAANDLSKPLTEQFTDYFYGVSYQEVVVRKIIIDIIQIMEIRIIE